MPRFKHQLYFVVAVATLATSSASALAQTMTVEQARKQIAPFYEMLNQPATKDLKALAEQALASDWKSFSSETEFKERDVFLAQMAGFGKLIPDLKWDVKDVLVDGNRIIVRSEASGTPVGNFLGLAPNGRSFKIMAIDIHTVKGGKAISAHHVEDWASALRQLSTK